MITGARNPKRRIESASAAICLAGCCFGLRSYGFSLSRLSIRICAGFALPVSVFLLIDPDWWIPGRQIRKLASRGCGL
jgi:hypothetical protein